MHENNIILQTKEQREKRVLECLDKFLAAKNLSSNISKCLKDTFIKYTEGIDKLDYIDGYCEALRSLEVFTDEDYKYIINLAYQVGIFLTFTL